MKKKLFALILSVALVVTMAPVSAFGATGTTSSGKIVVSDKTYEIAPDITEREYITNNESFSAQQMGHVLEVKLGGTAKIIAGYNDYNIEAIKSGSNWGMRKTTEQAQAAETSGEVNVVGAVNGDFFDMSNGRPRGALVMGGTTIQKSSYPCFYIDRDGKAHISESSADLPDDVQEAVGGAVVLVKDGQVINTSDTSTNPRTAIGIKADGTVLIYMVDGRQAPLSVGMNYAELAQTMIDLGCVDALNLDGGGSSTFATQRAGDKISGSDKQAGLTLRCSPSDGYERTVSSSLLVVATSTADGAFDHAILTPNDEVYTPGSTVTFEAAGADKSGGAANLPTEGLTWKITEGSSLGTITMNDDGEGVFSAKAEATGTVKVALLYDGKTVGSTSIELQWPDKLRFTNSSVSLDFGETSDLSFAPTYQGREVHYKDGDFEWSLEADTYKYITVIETKAANNKTGYGGNGIKDMSMTLNGNIGKSQKLQYTAYGSWWNYATEYVEKEKSTTVDGAGTVIVRSTVLNVKKYSYEDVYQKDDTGNNVLDSNNKPIKVGEIEHESEEGLQSEQTIEFAVGKFEENKFIADEQNSLRGTISVQLKKVDGNPEVGSIDVVVGMEPYVLMDFESKNGVSAEEFWKMHVGFSSTQYGYNNGQLSIDEMKESRLWIRDTTKKGVAWPEGQNGIVSSAEDNRVRFGNYACKLSWDFSKIGTTTVAAADFGFSSIVYVNEVQPTKLGLWVNVPEDLKGSDNVVKAILVAGAYGKDDANLAYQKINSDGSMSLIEKKNITGTTTYFQYYSYDASGKVSGQTLGDWAGRGWTWIEADISSLQMPVGIQRGYTVRITSPQNCQKGKGSILIDNLQMIYGTNTNDINNPVIQSVMEKSSNTSLTTGSSAEITTSKPQFDIALSDSEATDKYATGIDPSSVRVVVDNEDYTGKTYVDDTEERYVEISTNASGKATGILFQTKQLTAGAHSLKIRVKDYYGNETENTYNFKIKDEEAPQPAVRVGTDSNSAELGRTYSLSIKNTNTSVTDFVDSVEVEITIPSSYGDSIKDNLTAKIAYGAMYEQKEAPTYENGKITIRAQKKSASDDEATDGKIASIEFPISESSRDGDSFSYSVTGSYVSGNGTSRYSFSQGEQKIALTAQYTVTAGQAIAGYLVDFTVKNSNGEEVKEGITLYDSKNGEIENPYSFSTAGRYTVYAKDQAGNRSWNCDVVVSGKGADGNGSPYGIQNNASKNGATERTVTWLSAIDQSEDKAYIKLAETEEKLQEAGLQEGKSELFTFTQTNSGDAYRLNTAKLTGLTPSTTYYYQVGDGEKWSEVLNFTTADASGSAGTNFFIFGDIQTDSTANLRAAISKIAGSEDEYAFGIQTGDAIDNTTIFSNWKEYLTTLNASTLGSIDVIHTLGNHEYYGDAEGEISKGMFALESSTAGSYHSYEYGNVYVGVINNGGDILEALAKAKTEIAATKCTWKALVMHEPIYGTESLMEETQRKNVTAAIESAGFDVVFSGDDHTYARTYPMKGDAKAESEREGVVYYICGDLSNKDNAYQDRDIYEKMIPHNQYTGMYMSVKADSEKMVLTAYDYNGNLLDSYTISRTNCELGKHSFDETCTYDVESGTLACTLCGKSVKAADSEYTGILTTTNKESKVFLVTGELKTGWITNGEEILHAGEDGILHSTTTEDTATCLKNGYIKSTCSCGATYKGSSTWSKGHTWNDSHVCTVCGKAGIDMDKVELELNGTAWEYTGTAIRPSVSGWYKGQEIYARSDRYGTDAYKAYSNNINVGCGTVTFEGRGDFYGEKSIQFPIVPKSVKTVSAANTFANTVVLEWEAAAGAQYYNLAMKNSSGQWETIQEKITACKAIVEGLSPSTEYSFGVTTGADAEGESFEGLNRSDTLIVKTESESSSKTENLITEISASVDGTQTAIAAKQISGKKYIYLPSCADLTALKLNISTSAEALTLMGAEGSTVYSDEAFDLTKIAAKGESGAYELMLQADGSEPMKLYIMKAENLSAIFITSDDSSAGRNYVDSAKGNSAAANMLMLASSGSSVYSGHLKQVKSRGNSTFIYYDKKSYQIKLETPSDLLGTGESVKTWVLLAGYADATQMHDKLFKDLATNMKLAYTASSDWVDLYYDGEYRGIYLLSEKNSVGTSSVNITNMEEAYEIANPETYGKDMQTATGTNKYGQTYQYALNADGTTLTDPTDITGGYLIERNLNEIDEACGFYTREGGGFNVKSPEYASENALKYISEYYQEFEDAVLAKDAEGNYTGINPTTGKHYSEYCDKDSLVKIFLLQELAANCDGFLSSFYFYKDAGSGLLYAGPIWDQEITLGMSWSYTIDPTETRQYYLAKALIKIPDFAEAVKAYYQSDFQSLMTELIAENGKINAYAAKISNSAAMNYTMWPLVKVADPAEAEHLWGSGTTYEKVLSNMKEWLAFRINNLDLLYTDGEAHTGHSYVSEVTKPATTSEEGIRTYKCTVCGHTYTEKIEKVNTGGGGGGGVVVVPPTDTKTDDEGKAAATVKPVEKTEADGKKTTSATIDTTVGSKIVENAVASKSTEVVVNAATSKTVTETASGSKTEVAIPATTVSDIAEKTEAAVTIRSDAAEVTLDKEAVKSIAEQTGTTGMVKLIVETVAQDKDKLQLELKLETSKGEVSDFKGGKVSITVKLNSELAAKPVVCVYIDAHDVYHKVGGQKNPDGTFTFKTGHFSGYAVMAEEEADKVIAEQAAKTEKLVKALKLKARSAKTAKGNIKVTLTVDSDAIKEIEDLGYTVKYKFYRSTKKAASYKAATEKAGKTYTNTTGKEGTKYYYKARVMVYDAEGALVAKSELKQCKYAARVK